MNIPKYGARGDIDDRPPILRFSDTQPGNMTLDIPGMDPDGPHDSYQTEVRDVTTIGD